ncbi:MAG: hypothetical protein ACOYL4_08475 [Miltoncostaeaceae bacterium]
MRLIVDSAAGGLGLAMEFSLRDTVVTPWEVVEATDAIHAFAIMLGLMPGAREVLPVHAAFLAAHRA